MSTRTIPTTTVHVGFTGTRHGMTDEQLRALEGFFAQLRERATCHHGDCVGADAQFHAVAKRRGHVVVLHPGHYADSTMHGSELRQMRAFSTDADAVLPSLPHMKRNKEIIKASTVTVAAPWDSEQQGGTWKTIGFARKASRPLLLLQHDGPTQRERWQGSLPLERPKVDVQEIEFRSDLEDGRECYAQVDVRMMLQPGGIRATRVMVVHVRNGITTSTQIEQAIATASEPGAWATTSTEVRP